jgi:hypothetical protein
MPIVENNIEVAQKITTRTMTQQFHVSICTKELKTGSGRDTCAHSFQLASYTIAKRWKQVSIDRWIDKM